jgi:orotate phosphoribosyltransferase
MAPWLSAVHARRGHFKAESGHHMDLWMDLETLCQRPSAVQPLAAELAARIRVHAPDIVCGPLNEGAFVALMAAAALDREFVYAERFVDAADDRLYPVAYRLPAALHAVVAGRRVAIVNDVTSAGSAVRGTFTHLQSLGAHIVAIGSLLVLGSSIEDFARDRGVPLETLAREAHNIWAPADCPLCRAGEPLEVVGTH